ncbi:hypothetical protein UQ77_25395, partial [Shigella flexneri]
VSPSQWAAIGVLGSLLLGKRPISDQTALRMLQEYIRIQCLGG